MLSSESADYKFSIYPLGWSYQARSKWSITPNQLPLINQQLIDIFSDLITEELINLKGQGETVRSEILSISGKIPAAEFDPAEPAFEAFTFKIYSDFFEFDGPNRIKFKAITHRDNLPDFISWRGISDLSNLEILEIKLNLEIFRGGQISGLLGFAPIVIAGAYLLATPSQLTLNFFEDGLNSKKINFLKKFDIMERFNSFTEHVFSKKIIHH